MRVISGGFVCGRLPNGSECGEQIGRKRPQVSEDLADIVAARTQPIRERKTPSRSDQPALPIHGACRSDQRGGDAANLLVLRDGYVA